ncbi:MAG: mechanosensitive ion channel family protein, partial [Luminiphilus sp.]
MDFFLSLVSPISEATGIPITATALLSLFLLGLTGHFIIRRSVQRLGVFADTTDTRWDDVVYYSISPPAEWAMWVCLIFGSLSL